MPKFRKKPAVVEAISWNGENFDEVFEFVGGNNYVAQTSTSLYIKTLEGWTTADVNDWIIKGVVGEFYPCKPNVFEMTYEPA